MPEKCTQSVRRGRNDCASYQRQEIQGSQGLGTFHASALSPTHGLQSQTP
jgi:hypothetical protein